MDSVSAPCWVITDGAAGNERQAVALAEAVGVATRVWRIAPRAPWSWLAPRGVPGARAALPPELRRYFVPPWPELAIGCGRAAGLFVRALRRWSGGRTFSVQILDPRIAPDAFDLVIAPRHDGLSGPNVITTLGALNPVDADWLAEGAMAFPELALLPAPRTAVLIGASHRAVNVELDYCVALVERLAAARRGGSFLVSTSRRTPPALRDWLRSAFARFPGRFWSGSEDGPNLYAGYLAHAERIVVTPDSVNMLSEACASGKPVFTWLHRPARGKLARFHAALIDGGWLRELGYDTNAAIRPPPLRETAAVGAEVRRRWRSNRTTPGEAAS